MTASVQTHRAEEEEDIPYDNVPGEENEDFDNPNQEHGLLTDISNRLKMTSNWYEDEDQPGGIILTVTVLTENQSLINSDSAEGLDARGWRFPRIRFCKVYGHI